MKQIISEGYISNPAQLVTLRRFTISEGKAKGVNIIEVQSAGGLSLDILPDMGLDIGQARYHGTNMSWMCKNGYDSPVYFHPFESEFVNTFPGGLLYTCGLRSAGPANRDNGEWHPLHGRYHSLAADHICTDIEENQIIIKGTLRESALFGHCLEVTREIVVPVFGASVTVTDKITNLTPNDEEIMQIYHCNFGYPLLSEKARLVLPEERETIPRTEFARDGLGRECVFDKPVPNEEERVFFHKMQHDYWARIENDAINVKATVRWSGETLPILSQWRSMAFGDYVLGIEPTNCYIMGRHEERINGTLFKLKAFDSIVNIVKIEFDRIV